MQNIQTIREKLWSKLKNEDYVVLGDGRKTIELVSETFIADEPSIFMKPDNAYIQREIDWYMSQSLNVYDIQGLIPKIWKCVADKDGFINSNYGWCIFSEENSSQFRNCLKQLIEDPSTRRACMIYNRPSMQYEFHENGMSDFMCTFSTQQFIRDKQLVYCVNMRSNDAIFGYRNDWAWHMFVAKKLISALKENKIDIQDEPKIIWTSGSLHVYECHFDHVRKHFES